MLYIEREDSVNQCEGCVIGYAAGRLKDTYGQLNEKDTCGSLNELYY